MALSFLPSRISIFPLLTSSQHLSLPHSPKSPIHSNGKSSTVRAFKEWKEYEEAVKDKDLAKALKFLKSIDGRIQIRTNQTSGSSIQTFSEVGFPVFERDWEILDTCLNADDMRLVSSAYAFLKDRGLLQNYGKCRNLGKSFSLFPSNLVFFFRNLFLKCV
ncbi:hypothetical protein RDABS01_038916 [Bienertia sinuspersici]